MSVDYFKLLLEEIEKIHGKLDRLLASGGEQSVKVDSSKAIVKDEVNPRIRTDSKLPETRIHSPGFEDYEPTVKEEIDMDFSQVTVMNQTPLALLVVKKGFQQWLARQFIKDPLELGYQNGNVYDITLKVESNSGKPISWVTTKWVPFEVFKG